jgi:hypothetical protein
VLTTVEARLGIEPRLSALQADAFPLGYRALAGPGRLELPWAVLETAVLAAERRPCEFVFQLSKSNKKGPLCGRAFFRIRNVPGFYPPPPLPGFVAMMVMQPTCQGVNTQMRCGLSCRLHRASGLAHLNIFNSGADGWISTSDLPGTSRMP